VDFNHIWKPASCKLKASSQFVKDFMRQIIFEVSAEKVINLAA
jgi:hypothetical protein